MGLDLNDVLRFGKKAIKAGAPIIGEALLGSGGKIVADMLQKDTGQSLDKLFENDAALLKAYELEHAEKIAKIQENIKLTEEVVKATVSHHRVEEKQLESSDNFTRRARPTRTYIYMLIIFLNFGIIPVSQIFGIQIKPVSFPQELFILIGADCGIYSWLRTKEKTGEKTNIIKDIFSKI